MVDILLELQDYIIDYCSTNNIPVVLRFKRFGDSNKFYTNGTAFYVDCAPYYTEDVEDIKQFVATYLDMIWKNCKYPMNMIALYIEDIFDMDSWYELIIGGALFTDESMLKTNILKGENMNEYNYTGHPSISTNEYRKAPRFGIK